MARTAMTKHVVRRQEETFVDWFAELRELAGERWPEISEQALERRAERRTCQLAGPMFGYGDLMGGFFNFLTTIATNGRGRPFDTFLALTSHLEGNPRRRSKSLRPAGAAGRLLIYAQLVTGRVQNAVLR